jgi:hypothetical protein
MILGAHIRMSTVMNNDEHTDVNPSDDFPPPAQPLFFDDAMRSISLRVPCSDWGKMRAIAERFRMRESEVFRFGLKLALESLEPLFDRKAKGIDLVPFLVRHGPAFVKYFELDAKHLDIIVNAGEPDLARRVSAEDIELLAMLSMPNRHLYHRLQKLLNRKLDPFALEEALTQYLREKYLGNGHAAQAEEN